MEGGESSLPAPRVARGRNPGARFLRAYQRARAVGWSPETVKRLRALKGSAWLLAFSGCGFVLLLKTWGALAASDIVALRILAYAAWVYGGLGLSALLKEGPYPSLGLARYRGISTSVARDRWIFMTSELAEGLCIAALPPLTLSLLLASKPTEFAVRSLQTLLALGLIIGLAASLAALGTWAERLSPRSPRRTTLLFVFGPFALAFLAPGLPNLPAGFGTALARILALGNPT